MNSSEPNVAMPEKASNHQTDIQLTKLGTIETKEWKCFAPELSVKVSLQHS